MKLSTTILTSLAVISVTNGLVIPQVKRSAIVDLLEEFPTIDKRDTDSGNSTFAPLYTTKNNVPHRYIIVFKDQVKASDIDTHKQRIAATQKSKVASLDSTHLFIKATSDGSKSGIDFDFDIEDAFSGYAGYFLDDVIDEIKNDSNVAFVEEDGYVKSYAATTQTGAPWGLARISTKSSLNGASTGKYVYDSAGGDGVTSYIIDTGINTSHKDFEGRASWGETFTDDSDADGVGHGSHVAGTIGSKTYGVAKKANLVAVKVLDNSGSGTNSGVIKGIQYAASQHKANKNKSGYKGATANMSLGGLKSTAVNNAANAAVDAGIHFAVAAGNEDENACYSSPASADKVVTVGATNNDDSRAYFSNYGKCVDIFAPGVDVLSVWIGSNSATNTISGTSMATPHITGLLTYFLSLAPSSSSEFSASASSLTPAQLKKAIIAYGTQNAISDVSGSPNVLAYNGAGGDLSDFWASI